VGRQAHNIPINGSTQDHTNTDAIMQEGLAECIFLSRNTTRAIPAMQTLLGETELEYVLGILEKGRSQAA
jgi:hypothetical protein